MNPDEKEIQMIPVQAIRIANPRVRERRKFEQLVRSIADQGLKRPITITETKSGPDGQPAYDLVCGQGRLEAFIALGQSEIPAFVRHLTHLSTATLQSPQSLCAVTEIQWLA